MPISDEIVRKIIDDEEVISHRPADDMPPQLEQLKEEIKKFVEQEEDVLTYALFPQVALKFFEYRQSKKYKIDSTLVNHEDMTYPV